MKLAHRRSSFPLYALRPVTFAILAALLMLTTTVGDSHAQSPPPPPPAAPTGLAAASVSHDSVTLGWDDPDDASITGYLVLRRDIVNQAPGTFSTVEPNTGSAATTYVDTTVAPETRYAYRVKAINASGTSDQSNYVNVETLAAPTPSVPAQPMDLAAKSVSHDKVALTWDDPGDDTITGYQVLRRSRDGDQYGDGQGAAKFVAVVDDTGSAATTYTDTTVEARTRYVYRVKAINSEGMSERSTYLNVETPEAPEPPDKPKKTEEQQGDQQPRQSQNVTIPDTELRKVIEAALGKSRNQSITVEEMETLIHLKARSKGIESLEGLQHATNLETLSLRLNDLDGTIDLASWRELRHLDLSANDITGLQNLNDLHDLISLDVSDNEISGRLDLPFRVERVWAINNDFTSVRLRGSLKTLSMRSNQLSGEIAFHNTPNITSINLGYNNIRELTGIPRGSIVHLAAPNNRIANDPIDGTFYPNLVSVNLSFNANVSVAAGLRAPNLRTLRLEGNRGPATSNLTGAPNLVYVDISQDTRQGFSHPGAKDCRTGGTGDATPINVTGLSKLTTLKMSLNLYRDITGLSTLTSLEYLDARANCLRNLDVSGLPNLTTLRLTHNFFGSVTSASTYGGSGLNLYNLPDLESLDLYDNSIATVDLSGFPSLSTLNLRANAIAGNFSTTAPLSEGSEAVLNSLRNVPALRSLDLGTNSWDSTHEIDLTGLPALSWVNLELSYQLFCENVDVPDGVTLICQD